MNNKKFAKDLNDDGNRDEYRAASVMVYDYYPFGQLMPGRSLDTSGLCVTYNNYMEIPSYRYNDGGTLGTGGGGGATSYGAATLTNLGSKGVTASGTGGGLVYTITGITDQSIQINTYFHYLSGTDTITAWLGTNTSSTGTQLGSTRASYISPTSALPISVGGTVASPATITLVYKMANRSSRNLFSIDSVNYTTLSYTLVTSTFSRCGDPKDKYEFGFNGQMKSNEIAGVGNHNTALFWEYDTRLGRRWNLDPVKKPWESGYASLKNNPIILNDKLGNDPVGTTTASGHLAGMPGSETTADLKGITTTAKRNHKKPQGSTSTSAGGGGNSGGTSGENSKQKIGVSEGERDRMNVHYKDANFEKSGFGDPDEYYKYYHAQDLVKHYEQEKRFWDDVYYKYGPYRGPDAMLLNIGAGYYNAMGGSVNISVGFVDNDFGIFLSPAAGAGFGSGPSVSLTFGDKVDQYASGYSGIAGWGTSMDAGAWFVTASYGHSVDSKGNPTWDFYTLGLQTPGKGVSVSKTYTLSLIHFGGHGFGTVSQADISRMWIDIVNER